MSELTPSPTRKWWAQLNPTKYRTYRKNNREKLRAWGRKWRENNLERSRELGRIADRKRYRKNKEARRNVVLKARYGISSADYYTLLEQQNGVCAICGNGETSKDKNGNILKLAIDHNHETGKVRGLLCSGCNKALGTTKENPQVLRKAAEYLEAHAKDGMNGRTSNNRES